MAQSDMPFIWGAAGEQLTPGQISARRKVADAMLAQGMDSSPIRSPWQGVDRMAKAILGAYQGRQAEEQEAAARTAAIGQLVAALGGGPAGGLPVAAASPSGAVPAPGPSPAPAAAGAPVPPAADTTGKIYANDEPSPLDPPSGDDRKRMAMTILGESANEPALGQNAVASVIRTRAVDGGYGGDTPSGVVLAKNQFEPWNTAEGRARMERAYADPAQRAAAERAIAAAYGEGGNAPQDPTEGMTHFYSPGTQAALGRRPPSWSGGESVTIGGHVFNSPDDAPVRATAFAPSASASPGVQAVAAAMPAASASPLARPDVARIMGALANPYLPPGLAQLAVSQLKPQEYSYQTTPDGTILRMDPRGGSPVPVYTAATKPSFAKVGTDPVTGQDVMGFVDATGRKVEEYKPAAAQPAQPSTIPPPPAGVDPKVWREAQSKRAAEEGMPASGESTSKLRNEIQGLPSYKNVAQAAPVYKSMLDAAGRDNRAADVNMIYGMAKIMDPGSVVRESEMSIAQAIATMPQQLQAAIKSQMTGDGRLTPELRQAIMQEARSRITAYQGMFDQDASMYRGIAQRNRMNEADVLPTFGPFDEYKPAPAAGAAAPAAVAAAPGAPTIRRYNPMTGALE
jgi:hypothetical protein